MKNAHIQVIVDRPIPVGLTTALHRLSATTSFARLPDMIERGCSPSADLIVVVAGDEPAPSPTLNRLLQRIAERPRATLVIQSQSHSPPRAPAGLTTVFAREESAEATEARLGTMLAMRPSGVRRTITRRVERQHERGVRRFASQLELASRVQREFLPERLPRFGDVHFHAVYRPVEYVSGDIYDIQRLDDDHVGIALADATGHGIPAALLTVFIKRALYGREADSGGYRILQPNEVLQRLNRELLDASLSDCRFVAVAYALLNTRTHTLSLARGGMPYPILRRRDGQLRLLKPAGPVVGVLPDAEYETQTITLESGDSLVLYSDGLESVVLPPRSPTAAALEPLPTATAAERRLPTLAATNGRPVLHGSLATSYSRGASVASGWTPARRCTDIVPLRASSDGVAPDELVTASAWYARLSAEGVVPAVELLQARHDLLRRMGHPLDDLTLLSVEVDPLT